MAFNTIKIMGTPKQKEALSSAIITPGHLVERDSSGYWKPHATEGGNAQRAFALEDEMQGNPITTNYASGVLTQVGIFTNGDEVYALLADGENVAIADLLCSKGDGTLKKYVGSSAEPGYGEGVVAQALEAVDMSGSSGADPTGRIRVEIM